MGGVIFFPLWTLEDGSNIIRLFPLHCTVISNNETVTQYFPYSVCAILSITSCTLAIIEITKFENRMLQLKLGALNSLVTTIAIVLSTYFIINLIEKYNSGGQYGIAVWIMVVALLGNMIAGRLIRRDEKLVNESERLR